MNQVIFIPGLGDRVDYIEKATRNWPKKYNLQVSTYVVGWYDPADTYEAKLGQLQKQITELSKSGKVSLVGISAGGSLAVNALNRWPDKISRVVTICGPVRISNPNDSRLLSSKLLQTAISEIKKPSAPGRIMTLRPLLEFVVKPKNTLIKGAKNKRLFSFGHSTTIASTIYLRGKILAGFINGG